MFINLVSSILQVASIIVSCNDETKMSLTILKKSSLKMEIMSYLIMVLHYNLDLLLVQADGNSRCEDALERQETVSPLMTVMLDISKWTGAEVT